MNSLKANKHIFLNAGLFQVCWFSAVLGYWYVSLGFLMVMALHLFISRKETVFGFVCLSVLGIIGMSLDSLYRYLGVYHFSNDVFTIPYLNLPVWLACLWLAFCFTLTLSLSWLLQKPILFILLCTIMGPLSYIAGRRFEVLDFADSNIWMLALEWSVFSVIALLILFPKLGVSRAPSLFLKKRSTC